MKVKRILVTGGAGFIGSHIAEYYAKQDYDVIVFDDLSRNKLLKKYNGDLLHNWNFLKSSFPNVELIKADIRDFKKISNALKDVDTVFHAAAQTAVTTSIEDPMNDFDVNSLGTFNVLEASRRNNVKSLIYCSTNKVYGDNVNKVGIEEGKTRYHFETEFKKGIPESFNIDGCKHTPYGCSKLTGDLYVQDYARLYGLKTGVFRMSCIYGTRQFGIEDQGWVAWFTIACLLNKPLTIYGNGKQVRDLLYITDLIDIYDNFLKSKLKHGVFNTGGGYKNTLSLIELLNMIKRITGKSTKLSFSNWRPSDQKVYISDITNAENALGWQPMISLEEGLKKLVSWIQENKEVFV